MLQYVADFLWTRKLHRNIKKYNGVGLCSHCLTPLDFRNAYGEKEITISPQIKIMLFCPECHDKASTDILNGEQITTAFRRWYFNCSGLPQSKGQPFYESCLDNVLTHYGWFEHGEEEA